MPNSISSSSPSGCDPSIASCENSAPDAVAGGPPIVNLEPVIVTGDAGSQELLRRYDASAACNTEKQSALLSCPGIAAGLLNTWEGGPLAGAASSFHASIICGKDLRAIFDCHEQAEALQSSATQVVDDCHERGGSVAAGSSSREIRCEVQP